MTLDITADEQGNGGGHENRHVGCSGELAAKYPDMEASSSASEPQTLTFIYVGDKVTFQLDDAAGAATMTGTVSKQVRP
jgi:hypothetical protein